MASIANDPNGKRRILFVAPDKKRKTIRLGKVSQRAAETVRMRVEQLLEANLTNSPLRADTTRWLDDVEPVMADKLARVGLIEPPESHSITLGEHLDAYFKRRKSAVKASTITKLRQAERNLLEFFGADRPLESVTAGAAKDFES
jgi:hypothetical protein